MSDAELRQAALAAAQGITSYNVDFMRQPLMLLRPSAQPLPDVMRLLCGVGTQSFPDSLYSPAVSELGAHAALSPAPARPMSATSMPAAPQPGSARATADALVDWLARYVLSTGPFTAVQDATFLEKALQLAKLQEGQELPLTYNAVCQLYDIIRVRRPDLELLPGLKLALSPRWPGSCTPDGAPDAKKAKVASINDILAEEIKLVRALQRADHQELDNAKAVIHAAVRVMLAILRLVQGRKIHDLKDVADRVDSTENRFSSADLREAADILFDMVQGNMGSFEFGDTIQKEVKQAINAAIEDGTLATPQHVAAAMVPQPYHQPFMHGGYNNGGGHGNGRRGNWTQPRGKRGGQDKRQQREEQQQPQQQADGAGPSRVGRSRFSG